MKVFISVDMEGATAMTDPEDVLPHGSDYQRGRVFMTSDANAAVLGAFDADATEVVVNDSHWIMRNLLIEQIDPRARVIKGFHKPMCMMQGIDESVDAAVFVGYHSCAGTEQGVLAHTLLGKEIQNMLINGEPTGETRLNALLCGHFGVPVVFVAGDDTVCREAKNVLGQDLPTIAATCEYIPGVRRPDPYSTEFETDDMPEAMKIIFAELLLALQVGQKGI